MSVPARAPSDYLSRRVDDWRLIFERGVWDHELQARVLERVRSEGWVRHPSTLELRGLFNGKERHLYLKIFHRSAGIALIKDVFRQSKARRFWRQSLLLAESGFHVPRVVAAGEARCFRLVLGAFVLTEGLQGQAAPDFLRARADAAPDKFVLAAKRAGIRRCAEVVRRFHRCGFVHGDLVVSNIFVREDPGEPWKIYFMDNDRTRRYPRWLAQPLWKRNLVQLNRIPLPGISLQDRMRFLHAYLGKRKLSGRERSLAKWLEAKTRLRRKECDGADPSGNFRALMRWLPEPEKR